MLAATAAAGTAQVGKAGSSGVRLSSPALLSNRNITICSTTRSLPCPSEQIPDSFVYVVTIETLQITMAAFARCDLYFLFYVGVKN